MNQRSIASTVVLAALPVLVACRGGGNFLEGTEPIPGDPHAFDAIAALPAVSRFAGPDVVLAELKLTGVRANGTMDLEAKYWPTAEYDFIHRMGAGSSDLPLGARPATSTFETVRVTVTASHFVQQVNHGTFLDRGMRKDASATDAVPPTRRSTCTPQQLWAIARERGTPADAVARINYAADSKEGPWTLEIENTAFAFWFDADCKPIEKPRDNDPAPAAAPAEEPVPVPVPPKR